MRLTVRQLKRIISEAIGDGMPRPARQQEMSWSMQYGHAGHSALFSIEEPLYAARGDTPSVGAQIATLWLAHSDDGQARGPRAAEMLRNARALGGDRRALFRELLNHPNSGGAAPEESPLAIAFDVFTFLPPSAAVEERARKADDAYEAYAAPDEADANRRARGVSAPVPSATTESLRRDLRRRLRSL